jgi:hypothetical protein
MVELYRIKEGVLGSTFSWKKAQNLVLKEHDNKESHHRRYGFFYFNLSTMEYGAESKSNFYILFLQQLNRIVSHMLNIIIKTRS